MAYELLASLLTAVGGRFTVVLVAVFSIRCKSLVRREMSFLRVSEYVFRGEIFRGWGRD